MESISFTDSLYFFIASPNGTNCSAKSAIEVPPVNQEAIPFTKSAAVNNIIALLNDSTPFIVESSIFLEPSMKGLMFFINVDKSEAISGNELVKPSAIPPAIPPTNCPIDFPIFSSRFPPSPISHSKPGNCAKAPIEVKTNANSVIIAPRPSTPIIAPGIAPATADNAKVNAVNKPTAMIALNMFSVSIPFKASITPLKNAPTKFMNAFMSSGI